MYTLVGQLGITVFSCLFKDELDRYIIDNRQWLRGFRVMRLGVKVWEVR